MRVHLRELNQYYSFNTRSQIWCPYLFFLREDNVKKDGNSSNEEDDDEEDDEDEESSEDEAGPKLGPELSRAEKRALKAGKKKQGEEKKPDEEEQGEDDEDADLINPNHARNSSGPPTLSKRERYV